VQPLCNQIIEIAKKAADIVQSPWIIVHPGHNLSEKSKENMLDFFDQINDKRIIFENCPAIDNTENGLKYLFSLPGEMKELMERHQAGFVLDFGHAICTANTLGLDVDDVINGFLELKPTCFHISGIELDSNSDTHLHLYEVGNEMDYLKEIGKEKSVTFETPAKDLRNKEAQQKDIELFNKITN